MARNSFPFCGYTIIPFRTGKPFGATKIYREAKHSFTLAVTKTERVMWSDDDCFRYAFPYLNQKHAKLARAMEAAGIGNDATARYLEEFEAQHAKKERADTVESFMRYAQSLGVKLTAEQRKALK